MTEDLVGKLLDERFKILDVLGRGGMGAVYKARDTMLERVIALKVLHNNRLPSHDSRERFIQEGKIISSLMHPHISSFFQFGSCPDDSPYIAMEYLDGVSLRSLLQNENRIDWRRVAFIGIQVCQALAYAHKAGIVHRDLKPENIMLVNEPEPDFVKVVDFGLASIIPGTSEEIQKLTATGQLVGSINYISPEQCKGKKADSRTDIYSFGCILFEMLVGEVPFSADSPVGVIYLHANQPQRKFNEFESGKQIPSALEQIVNKAMMKDPAQRYQSMSELQCDLELLLEGSLNQLSTGDSTIKASYRWQAMSLMMLVGVFVILFGAYYYKTKTIIGRDKPDSVHEATFNSLRLRELINKGLRVSSLPLHEVDAALSSPNLTALDRAQLLLLRSRSSSGAEKMTFLCKTLDSLKHISQKSCPPFIKMETIDILSNQTNDFGLPLETIKLQAWLCDCINKTAFQDGQANYLVQYNREQLLFTKLKMANILMGCGKRKEAAKVVDEVFPDEHAPPALLSCCLALGRYEQAKILLNSHRDNLEFLSSYAKYYRVRGMFSASMHCIEFAKRQHDSMHLSDFDFLQTEALIDLARDKKEEAARLILNYADIDLANTSSIQKQLLRRFAPLEGPHAPRLVALLILCGQQREAQALIEKYNKANLPDEETQELRIMKQQFLIKSDSAANELRHLITLIQTPNLSQSRRIGLTSVAYMIVSSNLGGSVPEDLRLEWLLRYLTTLDSLNLYLQKLPVFDEILRRPYAQQIKLPPNTVELLEINPEQVPTVHEWAGLSRASTMATEIVGKSKEALAILDKIENEPMTPFQSEMAFRHELDARQSRAEHIARTCNYPGSLCRMARACIGRARHELTAICLQKARTLVLNDSDKVLLQLTESLDELEKGNRKVAQRILDNIDMDKVTQRHDSTRAEILQAKALAHCDLD